jgi:diacylglycerol kinase (ATP)
MGNSPFKGRSGLRRVWRALRFSLDGLAAAYREESAFRQEIWLAVALLPGAVLVPASLTQKALLVGAVMLVLLTELLNSAIEAAVDRISLDHHELAGRAKDTASAAVFVSLINCGAVWALVLADVYL